MVKLLQAKYYELMLYINDNKYEAIYLIIVNTHKLNLRLMNIF